MGASGEMRLPEDPWWSAMRDLHDRHDPVLGRRVHAVESWIDREDVHMSRAGDRPENLERVRVEHEQATVARAADDQQPSRSVDAQTVVGVAAWERDTAGDPQRRWVDERELVPSLDAHEHALGDRVVLDVSG